MSDDLKLLLQSSGLTEEDSERYSGLLLHNGFENEKLLRRLKLDDLIRLGINRLGHAKAVFNALGRLQRVKIPKRHAFYISHDKVDAGTEASMLVDAAIIRFADKPAFIDSDHKHLRTTDDYLGALLASNFCMILLTPRYFTNIQCLAEMVWAVQTETPVCVVHIDRMGLQRVPESITNLDLEGIFTLLQQSEWLKLEKMNISPEDVFHAIATVLHTARHDLVFQPHETRESRQAFFSLLWRYMGELASAEAGAQVYALDQKVDVRWRKGERWYSGKVTYIAPNGTYSILYDDGDRETGVTTDYMQLHRRPPVVEFQQDERVEARWRKRSVFFPGRAVVAHPNQGTYDIVYDDGDIEFRVSYELMRKVVV